MRREGEEREIYSKRRFQAEPFEKTEENREKTRLLGAKRRREEKEEEGERERRREEEEEGEEEEKRGLIIWSSQNFPGGTLVANLIGCVVLSCVRIVIEQNDCFEFQGDDGRLKMGVLVGLGLWFFLFFCFCFLFFFCFIFISFCWIRNQKFKKVIQFLNKSFFLFLSF